MKAEADFVEKLELSVRCSNALKKAGVRTMEQFMGLTKQDVLALTGAGMRTWREVDAAQKEITRHTSGRQLWDEFRSLVGGLNDFMLAHPEFRTVDNGQGFLTAVRSSVVDGKKRLRAGRST